MITPKNIVRHELIGLDVRIVESRNPSVRGIYGKVVDETRDTLLIEKPDGRVVRIIKKENTFSFRLQNLWVRVDGKLLVGRPEDRIKKKLPIW